MLNACGDHSLEQLHNLLRPGIGREIEITRGGPHEQVAHGTSHEIAFETVLGKSSHDAPDCFFVMGRQNN